MLCFVVEGSSTYVMQPADEYPVSLALDVDLLERRHLLPDRHVDGIGEVLTVRDVLDLAVLGTELLHGGVAEVLGGRVVDAEVEFVLLLELLAPLLE